MGQIENIVFNMSLNKGLKAIDGETFNKAMNAKSRTVIKENN